MQTHLFYNVSESAESPLWIWKIFLCQKGQGAWYALRWPGWHRTESYDCLKTPPPSFLFLRLIFERIEPGDEGKGNGNNPQVTWIKQLLSRRADLSYRQIDISVSAWRAPSQSVAPLGYAQTLQGPGSGCVFHMAVMRKDSKTWDPTGPTEALWDPAQFHWNQPSIIPGGANHCTKNISPSHYQSHFQPDTDLLDYSSWPATLEYLMQPQIFGKLEVPHCPSPWLIRKSLTAPQEYNHMWELGHGHSAGQSLARASHKNSVTTNAGNKESQGKK